MAGDRYQEIEDFISRPDMTDEELTNFVLDLLMKAIPTDHDGNPDPMLLTQLWAVEPNDVEPYAWVVWSDGDLLARLDDHPSYEFDQYHMAALMASAPLFLGALAARVVALQEEVMTYQVDNGYQNGYDHGQAAAAQAYKRALEQAVGVITEFGDRQIDIDDFYVPTLDRLKQLIKNIEQEEVDESD